MNNDDILWHLSAKEAIRDLVLRYCRAIDRKDYAALAELYHPDATEDHGAMFLGAASDYVQWLPEQLSEMTLTVHAVTNHLIVVDGERAEGEVYCQAYHRYPGASGDEELLVGGRYLDRYIHCEGRWQFSHREIVTDWNECRPSRCDFSGPMFAGTAQGAELSRDPSAAWFVK